MYSSFNDVFFTDDNNGYYDNNNGLFSTADGGLTWAKVNTTGFSSLGIFAASMFFSGNGTGYIVNDSIIYKENGSITSWVSASFTGNRPKYLAAVFATPNNNVYATTSRNELYKSTDGGLTFAQVKVFSGNTSSFCDLHFTDDNTGYVCAGNKIYKTTDAGNTWNVVATLGGNATFGEIHFTDANHGWACGGEGVVLIYNN